MPSFVAPWEIFVVLTVVVVVLYLFVRQVLPVPVTAMLAAAVLMLLPARSWEGAILSPEEGLAGFSSQATITILAMFVLSAGIERSGAVEYVSQFLTRWAGRRPRRQALTLGAIAGPTSGFVNNTPVVAMLIPVATRLAHDSGHSPSRLLMPMSFFAMLGGTLTLIGTSTSLLGNALLPRFDVEPFQFFSFTLVGVVALVVAALYFATIGMRLVPDRATGDIVERFDLKGFTAEFAVPKESKAVGLTLAEAGLVRQGGVQVMRVFRDGHVVAAPRQSFRIAKDDVFMIQGSREHLEALPERAGLETFAEMRHGVASEARDDEDPDDRVSTAELVVAPGSHLEGRTLVQAGFRQRYDALVLAVRHRDRVAVGPMARTKLTAGDVLLVQAHPDAIERLQESPAFILTRPRERPEFRRDKIVTAVGILAAVVVVSAVGLAPIVAAALGGAVLMVLTRTLRIEEFIEAIHWDVILLLAGIIPLGIALEKSGAAALIGTGLVHVGGVMPPLAFLILVFMATSLLTELISNNASVVLLIPIVVGSALALGLEARPFALTVMLSASTSMLTPVGYQTNTMVYAPGNYQFMDYMRVGGPLNLLLAVAMPLTIAWLFPLQ